MGYSIPRNMYVGCAVHKNYNSACGVHVRIKVGGATLVAFITVHWSLYTLASRNRIQRRMFLFIQL